MLSGHWSIKFIFGVDMVKISHLNSAMKNLLMIKETSVLIILFCIHFHLSKEGKRKNIELFQTPKLQTNTCSYHQYCIVRFKSIEWALVYAIIVIIIFQGTTFARKWTLDVLGQASLPAILKTTGRGIQTLQDPQFENWSENVLSFNISLHKLVFLL